MREVFELGAGAARISNPVTGISFWFACSLRRSDDWCGGDESG
jgi:hypothetical protein